MLQDLLRLTGQYPSDPRTIFIIQNSLFFIKAKLDRLSGLLVCLTDSFFSKTYPAHSHEERILLVFAAAETCRGNAGQPLLHQTVPVHSRHIQETAENSLSQIHAFRTFQSRPGRIPHAYACLSRRRPVIDILGPAFQFSCKLPQEPLRVLLQLQFAVLIL